MFEPQSIQRALARLEIERVVLAIHHASFPAAADDLGHGAPASARGLDFLRFVRQLGFDGLLLGPAGLTSPTNPSPYDGTWFARNPLSISFAALTEPEWGRLLSPSLLAETVGAPPAARRVDHARAHRAVGRLLSALHQEVKAHPRAVPLLAERRAALQRRAPWLARDARFEGVAAAVGHDDWPRWPASPPFDPEAAERFALAQLLATEEHDRLRRTARELGLRLYADAQIGMGHRDRFGREALFLPGYRMGAPPSRTNPDGQPWGYPVLDPRQLASGGPARELMSLRLDGLLADHDGVRVDHPHGWVCPWVYRDDSAEARAHPLRAVQAGARLHEAPDLPDHPALAELARVRPDQLDRTLPRHHDAWVRALEPAQIDAYATVFDLLVERARAAGRDGRDLIVEVLSTCPRPLQAVLQRHRLGRFRVTQKAKVEDPADGYRGDRARPEDWIMVGTHDTAPLRRCVEGWVQAEEGERRAAYLAGRLGRSEEERARLRARCAGDPGALAEAMLAELFLGPARHVLLFWVDLFGETEIYNRAGEVSSDNWTLRVPPDFEAAHAAALERGQAPSLERALALALHARGLDQDEEGRALAARLREVGRRPG